MQAVATQLLTPYVFIAGLLWIVLFLIPFAALWPVASGTRWFALGAAVLGVGVRLIHFSTTPPGLGYDDPSLMLALSTDPWPWTWQRVMGESAISGGTGWVNLPFYLMYRVTNSLLAFRIVGLFWAAALAVGLMVYAIPRLSHAGACMATAVAVFSPWSLWLSRNQFGIEIVAQELYLIVATEWLIKRKWLGVLSVGLLLAMLQISYLGARISLVFPLVLLFFAPRPRPWVYLICAYALTGLGILPHILTKPHLFYSGTMTQFDPSSHTAPLQFVSKFGVVLASLASNRYAITGTAALRGEQNLIAALPWCFLGLLGTWRTHGRAWLLLVLMSAVPCWLSPAPGGSGHRMMMMLLPLALLAGGAANLFAEHRYWRHTVAAASVGVAAYGVWTWFSPAFWVPLPELQMAAWELPYAAATRASLNEANSQVRIHPPEDGARLVGVERGFSAGDLDLRMGDFGIGAPLTVVWRTPGRDLIESLHRHGVEAEWFGGYIARVHLPRGFYGLTDDGRYGWRFRARCADRHMEFITPYLLSEWLYAGKPPCHLSWHAKALAPITKGTFENGRVKGTIHINDVVLMVRPPHIQIPAIDAGDRIRIELDSEAAGIFSVLRDGGGLLDPSAVTAD